MAVNYKSLAKTGLYSKKKIAEAKTKVDAAMASRSSGTSTSSPYSAANPYTKPLSAQGQANVNAQVSRIQGPKMSQGDMQTWASNAARNYLTGAKAPGVGIFGGTSGTPQSDKLEFNVLPGNKPGPISIPKDNIPRNTAVTTPSMIGGYVPKQDGEFGETFTKGMQFMGMVDETGNRLNPTGVGINLVTAGFGGALLRGVGKGVSWLRRGSKVANKVDDVLPPNTVRVPPRGTPKPPVRPSPIPPAMSSLGRIVGTTAKWGTAAGIVGAGVAGTVGVVRNALPPSGTPAGTTPSGNTPSGTSPQGLGPTGSPQGIPQETSKTTSLAPTSFASPASFDSSFASMASGISGGGSGASGLGGSGGTGMTGATALRGESLTEQQAQAQARALELQRQQSSTANVAPAPVGDQVDLAGLQALRDKAKSLLDQYGTEASTMPEFKATVQQMIASGIQNMRALQPTPPEPVEETPEETALYESLAPQEAFSVRQYMDDMRRSIGMPALETQKADLMRQMTAVNQAYQAVIDQIKENPNLPKGLAARRLTEQFEDQKFALSTIMSELDIIQDQIDSGNEQLSNARADLGLQLQYNEQVQKLEDRQYQRNMDKLGLMIESRAIGGMSDQEMRQWSAVTGISMGALQKLKKNALDTEDERAVEFQDDANGNLMMITYSKKNPLDKTVERIGSVKSPSGGVGGAGGFSDMDLLANTVLGTGSVAKQERDFATYEALKAQDPKKAEEWLYGKVATGLNATQKNDFRVFGSVVDGADAALAKIQQFANSNPGVYASIYNKAAPYLTASRDQNYVKLMQQVTSIGNEYRNAIFGASLTGNEQTEGLKVVIGNNDDLPTIITKLKGLSEYSQTIRQRIILDAAGQIGTSLSDGGPGTIAGGQQEAQYSMDDEMFNEVAGTQDSGGNTGYLSNLWNALLGR